MNKNLKKIIAITLTVSAFSAFTPATSVNLLTTKAYASNSEDYLDRLNLYDEDGDTIKLYSDSDYKDRVDDDEVEDSEVYYAKTTSDTINFDTNGPSDNYIRIFRGSDSSTKGKEVDDDIKLLPNSSTTTFFIKVYGEEPDDNIRYKDNDDYNVLSTYKVKVKYTGDDDNIDEKDDDIYLEKLSINGQMINLLKSELKYTYNVDSDVDEVTVRATPQDDYFVTIDGDEVDENDKYKKTVDLDKGENDIKIELEDDGDERVYTLVINRGSTSATSTSTTSTTDTETDVTTTNTVKSQWVQKNGAWQYIDATGNLVKNSWIQNYYYLKDDGNMAIGWLSLNGSWYYFGTDGVIKTSWQFVGGKWYYLDSQGRMQIGWIKDMNGKYYYLNSDGSMAFNVTIGRYKLGANGAWIGR